MGVNLDKDLHHRASIVASKKKTRVGKIVNLAVEKYLNQPSRRKLCMQ